jgi:hypothetical protein
MASTAPRRTPDSDATTSVALAPVEAAPGNKNHYKRRKETKHPTTEQRLTHKRVRQDPKALALDRLRLHKRILSPTQAHQFLVLIVKLLLLGSQSILKVGNRSFRLLGLLLGSLTTV